MMLKCGLLGRKLGHSYSPAIHGMLSDYSYQLFEREPEELEDFLLRGDWDGINVTIPYKKSVLPYCRELSPLARELGSVNTLVRGRDGSFFGDNTDAYGFESLVRKSGIDPRGKKALVLGSGGASVTVAAVLKRLGALSGAVISTGGGCVTREENYAPLHQNGRIVWLLRDTDKLEKTGRPVSLKSDLHELYARREPMYARFADVKADNNGSIEDTLARIKEALE